MWNEECGMRYDFKNKWFDNDYFISVLFSFHIPHSTLHKSRITILTQHRSYSDAVRHSCHPSEDPSSASAYAVKKYRG